MAQPDYRIHELNRRLQQRCDESDNLWWDAFATEFFEDNATLTLSFCLEDGPKRYTIGRTLIPRYFRSIFEGGVTDLYFTLKHPRESFHNTTITLDCDQTTMTTHHGKRTFTKVCTDGRLTIEFTFDDLMRIRKWHFTVRCHNEFVQRNSLASCPSGPTVMEEMSKNITRQGLTNYTLNYLRLCVILEPMQELMSRHKAYALNPRDCLKTTLFQKWQRMVATPDQNRNPAKRRKRKNSAQLGPDGGGKLKGKKGTTSPGMQSPGPPNFGFMNSDVMVVGEPSLMGGEFGIEDERLISRLENNQFDPLSASGSGLVSDAGPTSVPTITTSEADAGQSVYPWLNTSSSNGLMGSGPASTGSCIDPSQQQDVKPIVGSPRANDGSSSGTSTTSSSGGATSSLSPASSAS